MNQAGNADGEIPDLRFCDDWLHQNQSSPPPGPGGGRLRRVAFGAGDYSLDIGVTWSRDEAESRHARDVIVTASRAQGLEAPIDSVWARLEDGDGLVASARHAAAIGYQGKMCIHPSQLGPVNAVFTPTAEEVGFARRVVDGFAVAEAQGISAFRVDGKFVDYPILYRARRVIAIADGIVASAAGASR